MISFVVGSHKDSEEAGELESLDNMQRCPSLGSEAEASIVGSRSLSETGSSSCSAAALDTNLLADTNFTVCDRELERAFRNVDTQNTGAISAAQFDSCLQEFGIVWPAKKLKSVFASLDADKDKRITLSEYLAFVCCCPEILELKDAFSLFEVNETGLISWENFQRTMDILTNHNHTEAEIRDMFDLADKQHRMELNVMEFAKILNKYPSPVSTVELFALFDRDNNGFIDKEQLRVACKELNLMFSELEVEEMFLEADADNDGRITFEDLCNVWGVAKDTVATTVTDCDKLRSQRSRFDEARRANNKPKNQSVIKRFFEAIYRKAFHSTSK